MLLLLLVVVALGVVAIRGLGGTQQSVDGSEPQGGGLSGLFATPTPTASPTPEPTPTPSPTPKFDTPHAVDSSNPSNWGFSTAVEVNGAQVDSYQRAEPISFDIGANYTAVQGIVTFRGNNYREGASYGTVTLSSKALSNVFFVETGALQRGDSSGDPDKVWPGSGWVGQPLIVCWPQSTKQIMNMYDWAKQKEGLVEVILACLDGKVYFMDLDTGEKTRPELNIGMPFKGAGSLDPRGYPILYLGSGDMYNESDAQQTRALVYSLVDFSRLYEFGKAYDSFSLRDWHAYDSSPLVDAETDTLIYPGENGILYTIKLNTNYDEAAGTLSVNPSEVAKFRYDSSRSTRVSTFSYSAGQYKYWLGYESSAVIWGGYLYLATNDGYVQCIDLNTLTLVWAQDVLDDANGTLVLEEDEANRTAYLYAGVSLHFTQDADKQGVTPFFKINAVTGEIVWDFPMTVNTVSGASGGVQATAVLGQNAISDLVIIPFARTPDKDHGYTIAIDKNTGAERWRFATDGFCWSSPVAVYDAAGNAYIVQADSHGYVYLLNGIDGTLLSKVETGGYNIEASPAVYGNMIVIGTKGKQIHFIRIT